MLPEFEGGRFAAVKAKALVATRTADYRQAFADVRVNKPAMLD